MNFRKWMSVIFASLSFGCAHQPHSHLKAFTLRLKPGQDVKLGIQQFAKDNHLKAASIVSAVGSLRKVSLRYANAEKATETDGFHEIVSLSGTVSEDMVHLHLAAASQKGAVIGGHLMEGSLVYTTLELVMLEQMDSEYAREVDPTFGYKELVVKKRGSRENK